MAKSNIDLPSQMSTIVVDSGATTHILNDRKAFITFTPTNGGTVQLVDESATSILEYEIAVILLNKK